MVSNHTHSLLGVQGVSYGAFRPGISIHGNNVEHKIPDVAAFRQPSDWGHREEDWRGVSNVLNIYDKLLDSNIARVTDAISPGILKRNFFSSLCLITTTITIHFFHVW